VDPLAEQTPNWSPYAFCNNNPLFFTDPTGMSAEPPPDSGGWQIGSVWEDSDGSWTREDGYWQSNNDCQESIIDNVTIEGKVSQSFGDMIVGGLRDLDSWFYSNCFGTSTVDEDAIQSFNAGVNFSFEYKGTKTEFEFGLYSTNENSFGFYNSTTESLGLKSKNFMLDNFKALPTPGIEIFAKANSSDKFTGINGVKTDVKGTIGGGLKIGKYSSVGFKREKSAISGKINTTYSVGAGISESSTKVEATLVKTITIMNKTKQF
jgi:hypothetical protein